MVNIIGYWVAITTSILPVPLFGLLLLFLLADFILEEETGGKHQLPGTSFVGGFLQDEEFRFFGGCLLVWSALFYVFSFLGHIGTTPEGTLIQEVIWLADRYGENVGPFLGWCVVATSSIVLFCLSVSFYGKFLNLKDKVDNINK